MDGAGLLVINGGSSSIKAALFTPDGTRRKLTVRVSGVGTPDATLRATPADGADAEERRLGAAEFGAALDQVFARVGTAPAAIGHRVVQGGPEHRAPARLTAALAGRLRELVPLAPNHLPQELAATEAAGTRFPGLPQVLCFDTWFHRTLPREARLFGLPRRLAEQGVMRLGFHGLSCEYVVGALRGNGALRPRTVLAHLGSGSSLTALQDGRSVDTSMGFTPSGGVVMATRSGDLDPGVLTFLLRGGGGVAKVDADALDEMIDRDGGLKGLSGISGDMQVLAGSTAPAAAEARAVFCRSVRKQAGALAAVLGGLDALVFTGGVGEHDAAARAAICDGLGFLGVELDAAANARGDTAIHRGTVEVRVLPTDEESVVARHTAALLRDGG